jgi:hypothetical protein
MGEGMAKEEGQQTRKMPARDKDGKFVPGGGKPQSKKKKKNISARAKVHKAQLKVLNQVEKILGGNCTQAKQGNFNCAKFVLDWSTVSDLRTPLAKPLKSKSLAGALLKQLGKKAKPPSKQEV